MNNPIRPFHLARQLSVTDTFTQRSRSALQRDISALSEQMSTGLRINRPSDDAAGFEQARQLDAFNKELKQHQRSIDSSQHWINVTQDTLSGLAEQFSEASERAVQAANDTLGDDERRAIADRLRTIKDSAISDLNAKVRGEYLFAGNATQNEPFVSDPSSANYGQPSAGAGNYSEIDGDRERFIGPDERLKTNITGQEVHELESGVSVIDALDNLIQAVDPDTALPAPVVTNPPHATPANQHEAIQNGLDAINRARDHIIDRTAQAGNISNRLETADRRLEDVSLRVEGRRSEIEDADLAETLLNFQNKQTSLQAALKVTASVQQTSLVDYL